MVVFAGQGRSMELLWRAGAGRPEAERPGPKPGLSVALIVATAVAVADEEGLGALSMRAVGERLGRSAMALYTYVPGKSELIDLMYDQVLGELPTEYDPSGGWRPALSAWAADSWNFYLRHPWMLHVSQVRPVLGPNEFATIDTLAGILRETGLRPKVVRPIVGTLVSFVRGTAQIIADARAAGAATGQSETEWWCARSALLNELAPDFAERYPMAVWVESEPAPEQPGNDLGYFEREAWDNFQSGLAVLLDGIAAAVVLS